MPALHETTGQYLAIQKMIADGEVDPKDMIDTLEGLEGELSLKAEKIVYVLQNIDPDIKAIDDYIKALQERKKSMENRKEHVRNYLLNNMQSSGITKIQCPLFTITLAQGRERVVIDNEDEIADDYVDVETVVKPNKKKLMDAFKDDDTINPEGCHIERGAPSLRIKT